MQLNGIGPGAGKGVRAVLEAREQSRVSTLDALEDAAYALRVVASSAWDDVDRDAAKRAAKRAERIAAEGRRHA